MVISFNQVGAFQGVNGGTPVLSNPTSLQFGPDGRLYVSEQDGTINAFTVDLQGGEYVAIAHEELQLSGGGGVVKSITNHDDSGEKQPFVNNRQVTGLVTTGTAENPVLYVSSSDPRISTNNDANFDTNSGVLTRVTWTGSEWEAVDLIRGLPRSEENHSVNGMVLSADGTKLYLTVGGNTNNGAPSQFFAYTGEYALSGTVLEIDLTDIESRTILTDPQGGQVGNTDAARSYVYDLPTIDDPSVANDGVKEDANGLDVAGPWGGNDGFNMAILPADAPLRIFADGFRNHYDIVLTESGQFYTVDNGSNGGLGDAPIVGSDGQATNEPNDGGPGDPEPLFLIEDGGYYGHPVPARANQDLPWTVYGDDATPDESLSVNSVPDLSALVPDSVNIAPGFLIDPSKFTDDPDRLLESGVRVERDSPESNAIVTIGSSSNGLVEYTGDAFDGALQGALLVAQFNGNITVLNLNDAGTGLDPVIDPGPDELLGTPDDVELDADGVYSIISGLSIPLDVAMGPNGTVWVAEIGGDFIKAFIPSDEPIPNDPDFDNDGIDNIIDPFIRDSSNGGSVILFPGQTRLWDFDANQDNNLPGPDGYGGGLTGVMIDGITDFELFFQEESALPGQDVNLDNVKFITAAGGGTTVVENVSNGSPLATENNGAYLFHTGVTIAPTVEAFTITWTIFNPVNEFTGPSQQIGGYIGTGDQSNYLKLVAIQSTEGEIQILLEENDVVVASSFIQANDLFTVPPNQQIFFELTIDPAGAIATPTITYETGSDTNTVFGTAIDLTGTSVLDAILGNYSVQGQTTGLAVGLLSSNTGQPPADTFQAVFADVEITATGGDSSTAVYRVNAGGEEVAAIDGEINWSADTAANNSAFLAEPGSNNTAVFTALDPGSTVALTTPGTIFDTERWDASTDPKMAWAFDIQEAGDYEVRLFMGNGFDGTSASGQRVFDVAIEDEVLANLDDVDLSDQFGHLTGGMISNTVRVTDGELNIEFLPGMENPLINGIEIRQLANSMPIVSIVGAPYSVGEEESQVQISLLTDITVSNEETVDVTFEIVPIDATPQVDYEYLSGTFDSQTGVYTDTVTIAGGSSDATVLIDIFQDTFLEGSENFAVNIVEVSANAQIGTASATVTIQDDEVPNILSIVASPTGAAEPDVMGQFTVSLSEPADTDTTITYVVSGTATFGIDYQVLPLTVTIPQNALSATIDIAVIDDPDIEGTENITITLSEVTAGDSNIVIGASNMDTLAITDNEKTEIPTVLYRVNAGGSEVAAIDGGIAWSADTGGSNSPFLVESGSNNTATFTALDPGSTVAPTTPGTIFDTERWDASSDPEMAWAFEALEEGDYEVRLFLGNGFSGTSASGQRVFDVSIEGEVLANLDDVDLSDQFGHLVGGMISNTVTVTDGELNIEFIHQVENPLINGIEIIKLVDIPPDTTAPTGSLSQPLVDIIAETTAPQVIEVTFADDVDLDETTLDGDELLVTDSTGSPLAVTFVGVVGSVATYEVSPPGGGWDSVDSGTYSVSVVAGSVADVAGNDIVATPLGSFDVTIAPPDTTAPTGSLSQPLADIIAETTAPQVIEVTFADDIDLDETTLDGDELLVTDASGTPLAVTFVSAVGSVATYEVAPPGGDWDSADSGTYSVSIVAGSVTDAAGNDIAATALGSFDVTIAAPDITA
ncbi:MAG: malectin domain-containing carbohydrate-binding protein, partial [Cyanobacteria bacterium P01_D01_bin.105]